MWMFREELKTTKASHKKIKARMRALRGVMLMHVALIAWSLVQDAIALFIVTSYSGPYRVLLVGTLCLAILFSLLLLFSGLSK